MYIVHSTVVVPADKADEVIHIYNHRSKLVDRTPGFHSFMLLQNERKPHELTVQITWETKEDYLRWARGEDFKRVHELEKQYPDQELAAIIPQVSKYKVVAQ
ncbi:antibiotic biosynthesis monooxygenase family protein [Paenibacillus cellulositrophicus]|uniref:antibiotic biosynthesis monooxygenase family protein n=1 Tax=Paenibacillus cellulositrophicus TaxID=562959 RepID=UPI003D9822C5